MDDQNKDTLSPAASSETPANETQVSSQGTTESTDSSAQAQLEKKWAGKFKSAEDLENAYKSAESKIGQKTYAETIGQRVVEATGYSIKELEDAGYTPDQIVQSIYSKPTEEVPQAPKQQVTTMDSIKRTVDESKIERLEWKMKVRDFFSDHPEAKEFEEEIQDFHAMPQYRDMEPSEVFNNKLKKFVKKSEQVVQAKQSEKERASLSVTNAAVPEPKESDTKIQQYRHTGHFDDAVKYVGSWLRQR